MPVTIVCEHCKYEFQVSSRAIGKQGRCHACKQVFTATLPPTKADGAAGASPATVTDSAVAEAVVADAAVVDPGGAEPSAVEPVAHNTPVAPSAATATKTTAEEPVADVEVAEVVIVEDWSAGPPPSTPPAADEPKASAEPVEQKSPRDTDEVPVAKAAATDAEPPDDKPKRKRRRDAERRKDDEQRTDDDDRNSDGEAEQDGDRDRRRAAPRTVKPASQLLIRLTVLLGGLLGAAACGTVFYIWQKAQSEMTPFMALARIFAPNEPNMTKALEQLEEHRLALPYVLVAAFAGAAGGLMGSARAGVLGGLVMLAAVVPATVVAPKTLMFTAPLIVAALLAFLIQSPLRAHLNAELASAEPRKRVRLQHPLVIVAAVLGLLFILPYSAILALLLSTVAVRQEDELAQLRDAGLGKQGQRPNNNSNPGPGPMAPGNTPEPAKEVPIAQLRGEIDAAGKRVKLVKLDLSPAGFPATIEVPEGAQLKDNFGIIRVTKDDHFALTIDFGRGEFRSAKENLGFGANVVVNTGDLVFTQSKWALKDEYHFTLVKTAGHQDVYVKNYTHFDDKAVQHSREDCLLMIRCAESLARKSPPPADPAEALAPFKAERFGGEEKPGEIRLNSKTTDSTLALLTNFPDTRVLDLSETRVTDDGIAQLAALTKLERLTLSGAWVTDASAPNLAKLTKLKELSVGRTLLTDDGLKTLATLPELETLDLSAGFGAKLKGPGLAHFAGAKRLKVLRLAYQGFDDDSLTHLRPLTTLEELDLSHTKLLGTGLVHLNDLPALRKLNLANTKISDAGLEGIAGLTRLEDLDLHNTQLTSDGVKHLKGLSKLRVLNLSSTKLDDTGLVELGAIKTLKSVQVFGTKVTPSGAAKLKDALPAAEIDVR